MPVKILKNEGRELRLRISGESHTNFQNHPDLDEPELYIRAFEGKSAEKIFKRLCSDISKELSKLKL